jgi:hypothetical protein
LSYLCAVIHFFGTWTPANWIAFLAGGGSLAWNIISGNISGRREKKKNKREEFDRRIARPIEVALEGLWQLHEQVEQLRNQRNQDNIEKMFGDLAVLRSSVNRSLSRALRRACNSEMCSGDDWDRLGSAEIDRMAEYLDAAETTVDLSDREECLVLAVRQVELIERAVRDRIEAELSKYT